MSQARRALREASRAGTPIARGEFDAFPAAVLGLEPMVEKAGRPRANLRAVVDARDVARVHVTLLECARPAPLDEVHVTVIDPEGVGRDALSRLAAAVRGLQSEEN